MQQNNIEDFVASVDRTGRYLCPECDHTRKKHNKTLSVTVGGKESLYKCHHCEAQGRVTTAKPIPIFKKKPEKTVTHIPTPLNSSQKLIIEFFSNRGIDLEGKDLNNKVITGRHYFKDLNKETDAIGFVYGVEDEIQAVKWRPANSNQKVFTQDGAAKMFYGVRPLRKNMERIIVVEGEPDVVALESIGIEAYSVPCGAPLKVSKGRIDPKEDGRFSFVWDAWDELSTAKEVVLATDNDVCGNALKQELARRIGLEKCWEIRLPDNCKDATDAINKIGSDATKNLFTNAKLMPLQGVYDVESYYDELETLYRDGIATVESTGLESVDEIIKIKEGMVYIVTGYPGGGKSEFMDQIMVNLSQNCSWKWAVASFENPPANHLSKLIEKVSGKPFFEGRSPRISKADMRDAVEFLKEHFVFIEQKEGMMPSIDAIISKIKLSIARCGIREAVIDPYNYIDMSHYESEHKGITEMLSELSIFARAHRVAIFFVAHPQKIFPGQDGSMPVPQGSHISGSAAWWAKADIGMTVYRNNPNVEIHCWKARFKWLGKQGKATIGYNITNGIYSDLDSHISWGEIDVPDTKNKYKKSGQNWNDVKF
jgi:twinkle protein